MFNHNRGLWGYTGAAADGRPLTVQSTGIGGPSAAIVLEELIALGAGERIDADPGLLASLRRSAPHAATATIVSSDLFYEVGEPRFAEWHAAGARAVEMEAATLFALGALRGIAVGCVLAITDLLTGPRERIDANRLHAAGLAVGQVGAAALGASGAPAA